METSSIFSSRLIGLRRERNITQAELAESVKISRQSIAMYERGARLPDIDILKRIAEFFCVSCDFLVGLVDFQSYEAADISARTGLSERAVKILEVKQKLHEISCLHTSDAVFLSELIENSAPPLTFAEYMSGAITYNVQSETGNNIGFLSISKQDDGLDAYCYYRDSSADDGIEFFLSEFNEIDCIPLNFRRTVEENYRVYDSLSDKSGDAVDIFRILRKFSENSAVRGAKLLYNRIMGMGKIENDQTASVLEDMEDGEEKIVNTFLSDVCDESSDDVTALPIAALLDEITFNELKAALTKIRDKYIKQKEKQNAKEN